MSDWSETLSACEILIRKHAPMMMRVGENLREERDYSYLVGTHRPPVTPEAAERMKRLRDSGLTIEQVARKCRVSWRTAWKFTKQ